MLHCVAVCCSALQCVAVCCSVLQCATVCCSVLQCVAVLTSSPESHQRHTLSSNISGCCSVLQRVAVCCSALQCAAVRCSVLQCVAVCCRVLRHTHHLSLTDDALSLLLAPTKREKWLTLSSTRTIHRFHRSVEQRPH